MNEIPWPFSRFGNDRQRLFAQPDRAQHFQDFLHVMAVDDFRAPVEGLETACGKRPCHSRRPSAWLWPEAVHVHNGHEIVQLIDARQRRRLPHRAFGAFAVAHQDIGAVIQVVQPRAKRHAHAHAQALAQRTRRHVHKRQPRRRMPFKVAVQFAQRVQMLAREKPQFRPGRIKQRRGVALGKDEAVVVGVMRIFRIEPHVPEKQSRHQVRRRAAGSGMPAARRRRGRDGVNSQLVCQCPSTFPQWSYSFVLRQLRTKA